jgi:hypothetical protein
VNVKLLLAKALSAMGLLGLNIYEDGVWLVYPVEDGMPYDKMHRLFGDNAIPF